MKNFDLYKNLHCIYFVLALIFSLTLVFETPPFQAPDEFNHFFRSTQISQGNLIAERIDSKNVGGVIPISAIKFAQDQNFTKLPFHRDEKLSTKNIKDIFNSHYKWSTEKKFISFDNTALYSPFGYIPSSFGLFIAKKIHLDILDSFYLGRIFTSFICVILSTLAIKFCDRGKVLLYLLLSLPMTIFLYSSYSADAFLIASTALAIGLISKLLICVSDQKHSFKLILLITTLLTFLVITKPPYILILMILPCILFRYRNLMLFSSICSFVSFLILLIWIELNLPYLPALAENANYIAQKYYLISHFYLMPIITIKSLIHFYHDYMHGFIGLLGWMDANLPKSLYTLYVLSLIISCFSCTSSDRMSNKFELNLILIIVLTIIFIFTSMYLTWTPLKNEFVLGVQGRYFLPIALVFTLLFGKLLHIRPIIINFILIVSFTGLVITLVSLFYRYYQ